MGSIMVHPAARVEAIAMPTRMFVNLPVKDLKRSVDFFTTLGYKFNPQFTDEHATCMIVGEDSFVMLLVEAFFKTFTPKPIADATRSTEVLVALSTDSREEVNFMVETALAAGAGRHREPDDKGFMYQWGFEDLDGHIWEYFWMDPSAMQGQEDQPGTGR
jgi:predicted lactoylglutathione lyase